MIRPHRRYLNQFAALVLLGSLAVAPRAAQAEELTPAPSAEALKKARAQFGQALALQTAGDWAGALSLLKEVTAVKATPQVRFNVALCEERLGRLVAALGDYELSAVEARAEKASRVEDEARTRLSALRDRIPTLTVERGAGAESAAVVLDGVRLGDQAVGTPLPLDPGPHTVEATARGYVSFKRSVRLTERQNETIQLTLEPEPAPPVPVVSGGLAAPQLRPVAGLVVGGFGVVSLAASGVFFALRGGKIDELDRRCGAERLSCPEGSQSDIDRGKLYTALANVSLAVGVVAIGTGVALVLTSGKANEPHIALAPGLGGAQLLGNF